jgi:hypothetical protein
VRARSSGRRRTEKRRHDPQRTSLSPGHISKVSITAGCVTLPEDRDEIDEPDVERENQWREVSIPRKTRSSIRSFNIITSTERMEY